MTSPEKSTLSRPHLRRNFLSAPYHPEKDYEQNAYRISSWDSLDARLYPLLTDDVVRCFNGSDIKMRDSLFQRTHHHLFALA